MYRLNDKFGRFDQRLTIIKIQSISALNPNYSNYSNKSYFFVILATASIISFATFSASASVAASE